MYLFYKLNCNFSFALIFRKIFKYLGIVTGIFHHNIQSELYLEILKIFRKDFVSHSSIFLTVSRLLRKVFD